MINIQHRYKETKKKNERNTLSKPICSKRYFFDERHLEFKTINSFKVQYSNKYVSNKNYNFELLKFHCDRKIPTKFIEMFDMNIQM